MSDSVIKTANLTRIFGEVTAVNNIAFEVKKGELFGLLGPNGAGKTTLLRLLTGQLEPSQGTAKVLGIDPSKDPIEIKNRVGIVPEIESPPSFLTPKEYLLFIGLVRDLNKMETRTDHWLKFLDLVDLQNTPNKDLSKGERQKVMLAAAFIHEPSLLFLDEPFMGLDPYYQKQVKDHLNQYISNGGTIFMCTHILELAEKMCTRIAIIDHGKVIVTGTLDELTKKGETLDKAFLRYTKRKI
jgi:ABC-2 type transport system ATP-binding protein